MSMIRGAYTHLGSKIIDYAPKSRIGRFLERYDIVSSTNGCCGMPTIRPSREEGIIVALMYMDSPLIDCSETESIPAIICWNLGEIVICRRNSGG
jgi:hypothetical protein